MRTILLIDDTEPAVRRLPRIVRPRTRWQTARDTVEVLTVIALFLACFAAVLLA